jgi:hypothetical protein
MPASSTPSWHRRRHDSLNDCNEGDGAAAPPAHTQTNVAQKRPDTELFEFDIRPTEGDIGA